MISSFNIFNCNCGFCIEAPLQSVNDFAVNFYQEASIGEKLLEFDLGEEEANVLLDLD